MTFERKIAGAAPATTSTPTPSAPADTAGAVIEVTGGEIKLAERGHKDWQQVINQNFELRSLMTTAQYTQVTGTSFDLNPDKFGYNIVRAAEVGPGSTAALGISIAKPAGVPTSQHTPSGKFRHRQRWGFLEVFYPSDTQVSFSGSIGFGIAAWRAEHWDPADLELLIGAGNPVATALLVRDVKPQPLNELLAEAPREAGTADLFFVSFNERTGQTTVTLLSGGMPGVDPAPEPEPGENTEPVDDILNPPAPGSDRPFNQGQNPGSDPNNPRLPSSDTDVDTYYDPATGLPLTVSPATATLGTLVALHTSGLSFSQDGGATWAFRALSLGTLKDVVAGPAGIWLLNEAGELYRAISVSAPFERVTIVDNRTVEVEIPLTNGDFETGDLTGWESIGADMPRVLRTVQPEQRPGSTHYLTRDWRVAFEQDFRLKQRLVLPEGITGDLTIRADVFTQNGDVGRISLIEDTPIVVVSDDFPVSFSAGVYRSNGFASYGGRSLNLVGQTVAGVGSFTSSTAGIVGIQINGDSGQNISGTINWRVEYADDGSLFDGDVLLRIYDLDNPNGAAETLTIEGIVDYDLLTSSITATPTAAGVRFNGVNSDVTGVDNAVARWFVRVKSEFVWRITGRWQLAIGMRGTGMGTALAVPEVYNSEQYAGAAWRTLEFSVPLESLAPKVAVLLEGIAAAGYSDVYFDNVRLSSRAGTGTFPVSAIAPVEGSGGGAEFYQGPTVFLPQTQDGQPLTAPAPEDADIQAADAGGPAVRAALSADGLGLFVWDQASGDYTDGYAPASPIGRYAFACDPFLLFGDQAGNVYDSTGTNIGTAGGPVSYVSGDRRREAALLTVDNGLTRLVTREGGIIPLATLPQAAPSGTPLNGHRTMNMDVGRCLGWRAGSRDLFWSDAAATGWNVAGAIREPIIRIVEYR